MSSDTDNDRDVAQSGSVTPGHLAIWTTDGVLRDAGTPATPSVTGGLGITSSNQVSIGINNALNPAPYNQLGLGITNVSAWLTVTPYNGAAQLPLNISASGVTFIIAGVPYAFPGSFVPSSAVTTLPNIATLRASSTVSLITAACYVAGYYAGSDGGEGAFSLNASDTTSADNGGTIIVDASARRWYRETNGLPVTTKQFGAKGDGATDDTAAIQAAFNAGRPLYAPPGTYVTGSLNVPSRAVLTGAARGLTIFKRKASSAAGTLFNIASGADGVSFSDFAVDGNKANNTNGFSFSGTGLSNLTMRSIVVSNDVGAATLFTNLNPLGLDQRAIFEDCEAIACAGGGWAFSGANNVTIADSLFEGNGSSGVSFASVASSGIEIRDCRFIQNASHGLALNCIVSGNPATLTFPITDVIVDGCWANGNGGYGYVLQVQRLAATGNIAILNGVNGGGLGLSGFLINSNRFTASGNTSASNVGDGFDVGGSSLFAMVGNVSEFNGYYGIEVDACFQGTVSGNYCGNNFQSNPSFSVQAAIYHGPGNTAGNIPLANGNDRVAITGNTVEIGPHQNYAIYVASSATNTTVVGNDMIASGQTDDLFCAATVAAISGNLTRWTSGNASGPLVSAATTLLPDGSDYFEISGTTTINQLVPNSTCAGRIVTLFFQGALTLGYNVAANGFVLSGSVDFVATADSMITLRQRFDGKWYEEARVVH